MTEQFPEVPELELSDDQQDFQIALAQNAGYRDGLGGKLPQEDHETKNPTYDAYNEAYAEGKRELEESKKG